MFSVDFQFQDKLMEQNLFASFGFLKIFQDKEFWDYFNSFVQDRVKQKVSLKRQILIQSADILCKHHYYLTEDIQKTVGFVSQLISPKQVNYKIFEKSIVSQVTTEIQTQTIKQNIEFFHKRKNSIQKTDRLI